MNSLPGPSFRQDQPQGAPHKLLSMQSPAEPLHGQRPQMYAFLGTSPVMALGAVTPSDAVSCGYTAADLAATPDAPQSNDIQSLAAQLGYSPAKIFEYVYNNIAFQPYSWRRQGRRRYAAIGCGRPHRPSIAADCFAACIGDSCALRTWHCADE